jgi:hypothetical protein
LFLLIFILSSSLDFGLAAFPPGGVIFTDNKALTSSSQRFGAFGMHIALLWNNLAVKGRCKNGSIEYFGLFLSIAELDIEFLHASDLF